MEPQAPIRELSISIHALREEGDAVPTKIPPQGGISIHALREEGDPGPPPHPAGRVISIHALREEGDLQRTNAKRM